MGEALVNVASQIENDFEYHPATERTGPIHTRIRMAMRHATERVLSECGVDASDERIPTRELSLFKTAMEEAMFWANAHVARNMSKEDGK